MSAGNQQERLSESIGLNSSQALMKEDSLKNLSQQDREEYHKLTSRVDSNEDLSAAIESSERFLQILQKIRDDLRGRIKSGETDLQSELNEAEHTLGEVGDLTSEMSERHEREVAQKQEGQKRK